MKAISVVPGTLRIAVKDQKIYEKTKTGWKRSKQEFPQALHTMQLFKAQHNLKALIDSKESRFFKGQVSPEGRLQGARINILPDGTVLDKAYSLFAPHLTFHDESSHDHWDVIYQNPNGKYAYLYTQQKRKKAVAQKYHKVTEFAQSYPTLQVNVLKALEDPADHLAVPMYTLLATCMRVGNELYYKAHGHKGLTTLTKRDISIKGEDVCFKYIAKDGVPMRINQAFPTKYVQRLKQHMRKLKDSDFVFTDQKRNPLKDTHFMQAFEKYCGKQFYPHIVRSYYATQQAQNFLKTHKHPTKQEVKDFFISIAEKLGHKRFDKKHNVWIDSYAVTIHHYLNPQLVDKLQTFLAR